MPSAIKPTTIGSSGKAPTRTVPTTALRSGGLTSAATTSAGLVVHSGSGLTSTAITTDNNGGAGTGAESVEVKIAHLDDSVRRRRVLSAVLTATGTPGDFVGKDGLQALLSDGTDPSTGSSLGNTGGTVFIRWGTYTLDAVPPNWIARIGLIGEERGRNSGPGQVTRPVINISQATDYQPYTADSNGGFHKIQNVTLSSLSTGRWRIGANPFSLPILEAADNVLFDSCLLVSGSPTGATSFYRSTTIQNSFFLPKAGCLVTSNYNVEITNGNMTFRDCRFEGISPSAASPSSGAVVRISGSGYVLFERCSFTNLGDEALVDLTSSTATVIFRNCTFTSNQTVSATARAAFVASAGYGVIFEDCTMSSKGKVFDFSDFGGLIDGLTCIGISSGSVAQVDPVLFSFQGNSNAYTTNEHAWMDIRKMEVRVDDDSLAALVNSPAFLVSDYVRGGKILLTTRANTTLGAGSFFKIDRTGSTPNQIAVFDEITIDSGLDSNPVTANALVSLSGCAAGPAENTPQVHIGNLNLVNIGNTTDRTYVELVRAVKVDNLTLEGTTSSDNVAPFITVPGNNIVVDRLAIDALGSSSGLRSSASATNGVVHVTGSRVSINSGFYHHDTTIGDNTNSIFRIEGAYVTFRRFYVILDYSAVLADGMFHVRADHFTMTECFLWASAVSSAKFWDIDGDVVTLLGNTLKSNSSGENYGDLAGNILTVNGNSLLTTGAAAPTLNVTATNAIPAVFSDTNNFVANAPAGAPIT